MSRSSRQEKLEATLRELEQDFTEFLVPALRRCVSGQWGIFGQNDTVIEGGYLRLADRLKSVDAEKLLELGEQISALRSQLGKGEFLPYCRFLEYRQKRSPNVPGEPQLAAQFLAELGIPQDSKPTTR